MPTRDDLSPEEADFLDIAQETAEERAEIERERQIVASFQREFLIAQMQNKTFRTWLMGMLNEFGTFGHSFGASPTGVPDPLATWFALGMKAAGWRLWEIFDDAAPDWTSMMRREARAPKEDAKTIDRPRATP